MQFPLGPCINTANHTLQGVLIIFYAVIWMFAMNFNFNEYNYSFMFLKLQML